ncbi:MAG: GIY-YIG nuclease family protein [Parcubacteria group bacterium]
MKNLIYKITNKSNNKVYIGLTTRSFKQRVVEHKSRFRRGERDHKLYQAMSKYGEDQFEFSELFYSLKAEDLKELEILFIKEYNSYNRGYNMTAGGDMVSDETRKKLSKKFKGRKITWYDKIMAARKQNGSICGGHNKKHYKVKLPSGEIVSGYDVSKFCKEHNLDQSNLNKTLASEPSCKGYILLERSTTIPEGSTLQA